MSSTNHFEPQTYVKLVDTVLDERDKFMLPSIGIITALPKEYTAVKILLANGEPIDVPGKGAGREYWLAHLQSARGGKHTLVLALADMGNNAAASRATLLLEHFPNVESIIMTGIAGGVPHPEKVENHVRLGDIVISNKKGVIAPGHMKVDTFGKRYLPTLLAMKLD